MEDGQTKKENQQITQRLYGVGRSRLVLTEVDEGETAIGQVRMTGIASDDRLGTRANCR